MSDQANAEKSKDYILGQIKISSKNLESELANSVYAAVTIIAINFVVLLLLLLIVSLILFLVAGIITPKKAIVALAIASIFLISLAWIFVHFIFDFSVKHLGRARLIFDNYTESEDALKLVSDTFTVYKIAAGI